MRWRFLDTGAMTGADNMALDAGLLDRAASTGESVLRVYAWSEPTLSFGRHETVRELFDAPTLVAQGVGAVRRPTGGRVLLHHHEVTYSVSAALVADESLSASYARINGLLLEALSLLGVRATPSPASTARRPGGAACFAEPSEGELVVGDRKLVGSAQVRDRGALLQHGSILLEDDQARITRLARRPMTPSAPAASLRDILGREIAWSAGRDALRDALVASATAVTDLAADEAWTWAAPHAERYSSLEWTWRR